MTGLGVVGAVTTCRPPAIDPGRIGGRIPPRFVVPMMGLDVVEPSASRRGGDGDGDGGRGGDQLGARFIVPVMDVVRTRFVLDVVRTPASSRALLVEAVTGTVLGAGAVTSSGLDRPRFVVPRYVDSTDPPCRPPAIDPGRIGDRIPPRFVVSVMGLDVLCSRTLTAALLVEVVTTAGASMSCACAWSRR